MYCNKCGAKQPTEAAFCSSCGNPLSGGGSKPSAIDLRKKKTETMQPAPSPLPSVLLSDSEATGANNGYRYPQTNPSFLSRNGSWLALAFLVVLIASGLFVWNQYKSGIDERSEKLQADAALLAQNGDYSAARDSLQQAASLTRDEALVATDLEYIQIAEQVQDELQQATEKLASGELDKAQQLLEQVGAELNQRSHPMLEREKAAFSKQQNVLTVLLAQQTASGLDNVTALAPLLEQMERMDTAEAEQARSMIVAKIVEISSAQAETLLEDQSFTSASQAVEQGLNYAPADSTLIALNGKIESAKAEAEELRRRAEAEVAEAKRQAEAEEERRIEQAVAQDDAEYTVQSFYSNLSLQDYSSAYAILGSNWQKGTGYSDFVSGYDNTYDVWIDSLESTRNGENVEVTIFLTAWESSDFGMVYSTYRSVYQVGYENGTMKILSGKGEKLS